MLSSHLSMMLMGFFTWLLEIFLQSSWRTLVEATMVLHPWLSTVLGLWFVGWAKMWLPPMLQLGVVPFNVWMAHLGISWLLTVFKLLWTTFPWLMHIDSSVNMLMTVSQLSPLSSPNLKKLPVLFKPLMSSNFGSSLFAWMPPLYIDCLILLHHWPLLPTQFSLPLPLRARVLLAPTAKCWVILLRLVGNLGVEIWVDVSIFLLTASCINMRIWLAMCWSIISLPLSLWLLLLRLPLLLSLLQM